MRVQEISWSFLAMVRVQDAPFCSKSATAHRRPLHRSLQGTGKGAACRVTGIVSRKLGASGGVLPDPALTWPPPL